MSRPIHIILGVAAALAYHSAIAQEWFSGQAVWQHEYFNGAFLGYVRMEVAGDTLVGGEQAKVLSRTRVTASFDGPWVDTTPIAPWVVRETDGVVEIWEDWHLSYATLFDMNTAPGDQWTMARTINWVICDPESFVEVIDTGSVLLEAEVLKWLAVDLHYIYNGEEWQVISDTIMARIGTLGGYFVPHDFCDGQVDGSEGGPLRCYQDDEVTYTRTEFGCETLLGMAEGMDRYKSLLLPLNDHGRSYVLRTNLNTALHMQVFDMLGHLVNEGLLMPNATIDFGRSVSGVLVYNLRDHKGRFVGAGRIVLP